VARLFRYIPNAPLRQSHSAAPARVQPQQSFASVFERVSVGSARALALLRCVMPNVDALLFVLRWRAKTTPLCVGLARTRDAASTWGLRGLFAFMPFNKTTDRKEVLQLFAAAGPHNPRRGSARWPRPTTPSTLLPPFTAACSFDVNLFALAIHRPACCAQARAGHLARAARGCRLHLFRQWPIASTLRPRHHPQDAACTAPCDDKAAICAGISDACLRLDEQRQGAREVKGRGGK
jgi:hypothetical protein